MTKEEKTRRRTEMFATVERCKESKKTHRKFCQDEGISYYSFKYWIHEYRQVHGNIKWSSKVGRPKTKGKSTGFIPLSMPPAPNPTTIEIRYPNGVVISLDQADQALLKTLITAV
jgi:hypothetical protein